MFWKPGTNKPPPPSFSDRGLTSEPQYFVHNPRNKLSYDEQRSELPISRHRRQFLYLLDQSDVVLVQGSTGSGKTTQLPQYIYESGYTLMNSGNENNNNKSNNNKQRCIGCTQPRRVSTVTIANRVANEMGEEVGKTVGYSIRFEHVYNRETRIKYLTDGMLLREMLSDPLLSSYCVLIIDEAHERTIATDLLIALLRKILLKRRGDLKVVVSSATLEVNKFFNYFTGDFKTATISVEGRAFPVDIHYIKQPLSNYLNGCVSTCLNIHSNEANKGDILAFLTGQEEIEQAVSDFNTKIQQLKPRKDGYSARAIPLFASMPIEKQKSVFNKLYIGDISKNYYQQQQQQQQRRVRCRKIIFSTNVAESSITIPGIVYVVDCGFVKIRQYNPKTSVDSLVIIPISKHSAKQRSGRAGRVCNGKCYRLYPRESYKKFENSSTPEIIRNKFENAMLYLKALGLKKIYNLKWLSSPPSDLVVDSLSLLYSLNALNDQAQLTDTYGKPMSELPIEPRLAKMLLYSGKLGCSNEILTIAAMLSVREVWNSPIQTIYKKTNKNKFAVIEGDHISLLNVYKEFIAHKKNKNWCDKHYLNYKALMRAIQIREQLIKYLKKFKIEIISVLRTMKTMQFNDRNQFGIVEQNDEKDNFVLDTIRKCIVAGYFSNAAKLHTNGTYRSLKGDTILYIHPNSVLFHERLPEYIIFHEIVFTTRPFIKELLAIQPEWLHEIAPHYYEFQNRAFSNKTMKIRRKN
ncbi:atp-dependent RNA helicase dhx33 [Anaeramoeba flamelloides]|uniref:RNA helicase n=1 Tax=Anaeramoeba flamelloides TaxID=1746091 RepID=A0AAV7YRY9_9EUKA|nr:atp-dependent RNA helicase dhx33 [Anaeramoeba flamelloides]